jgi:predicted kinase
VVTVTVVTGPPCSGKSTYVRNHAKPGDIVIDFDTMAQAFGSPAPHDHSAATRHVTIMARRAAIAAALTVNGADVWIVDCNIGRDRLRDYQRVGAHIVGLDVDRTELHARAGRDRPRLWHRLIDEWRPVVQGERVGSSREW